MTVADLLLSPDKQYQLTAALSGLGVSDPLGICIGEAVAEVDRYIAGYSVTESAKNGWIRSIALCKAYGLVGPVPEDVKAANEAAIAELRAIAEGKRPNLPRLEPLDDVLPTSYGSEERIDS